MAMVIASYRSPHMLAPRAPQVAMRPPSAEKRDEPAVPAYLRLRMPRKRPQVLGTVPESF
jgi:hypothetical protein